MGEAAGLLAVANIPGLSNSSKKAGSNEGQTVEQGVLVAPAGAKESEVAQSFITALKKHRHWDRPQKDQLPA